MEDIDLKALQEIANNGALLNQTLNEIVDSLNLLVLPADHGGTGHNVYAVGDLLYADTTETLARLPDVAVGSVLVSGGVNAPPSWGPVPGGSISGVVPIANGGTNATTAPAARENLGLEIGVDVQAYSAELSDLSALTPADGAFIVGDGANFITESGSTARTSLGLGTLATQNSTNVSITGGDAYGTLVEYGVQATTSGTSIDFSSIPAGVKRITLSFSGLSTNGTSNYQVQLGTGGTPTTSGYAGSSARLGGSGASYVNSTAAMLLTGSVSSTILHVGTLDFVLIDPSTNLWVARTILTESGGNNEMYLGSWSVALSGALDFVRFTTSGGANTFDAGSMNLIYE
jgi:hypothetical protein